MAGDGRVVALRAHQNWTRNEGCKPYRRDSNTAASRHNRHPEYTETDVLKEEKRLLAELGGEALFTTKGLTETYSANNRAYELGQEVVRRMQGKVVIDAKAKVLNRRIYTAIPYEEWALTGEELGTVILIDHKPEPWGVTAGDPPVDRNQRVGRHRDRLAKKGDHCEADVIRPVPGRHLLRVQGGVHQTVVGSPPVAAVERYLEWLHKKTPRKPPRSRDPGRRAFTAMLRGSGSRTSTPSPRCRSGRPPGRRPRTPS
jgi:hypothetical protein